MKRLVALMMCAVSLGAAAQINSVALYNPDYDNNGWIGVEDLIELLSVYNNEFVPESWITDSLSAHTILPGYYNYVQCVESCNGLSGRWKMTTLDEFGAALSMATEQDHWISSNAFLSSSNPRIMTARGDGEIQLHTVEVSQEAKKCICYIRSSPLLGQGTGFEMGILGDSLSAIQDSFEDFVETSQEADSINSARVDSLEALVSAFDVQEGGYNDSSVALELSLVQTGVAPLCSSGSGINGEESSNNYSYSLSTCGSSNVTLDFVSANWRKFSLSSEMNLSDTLNISMKIDQYNTYDGSWTIQIVPVELVRNENGTYDFVLYARGGSGNSQCCTGEWDVNSYFAEPAFQAKSYSSSCYCSSTWRHIEIWYEMDGFLLDSGIRFGVQ